MEKYLSQHEAPKRTDMSKDGGEMEWDRQKPEQPTKCNEMILTLTKLRNHGDVGAFKDTGKSSYVLVARKKNHRRHHYHHYHHHHHLETRSHYVPLADLELAMRTQLGLRKLPTSAS